MSLLPARTIPGIIQLKLAASPNSPSITEQFVTGHSRKIELLKPVVMANVLGQHIDGVRQQIQKRQIGIFMIMGKQKFVITGKWAMLQS